jgi:hypothetical protein
MFGAITPSPHAALPSMKSPPKYNNQVVAFSTIEAAPVNDNKAFRLNKKGEARTDASQRQARSRSSKTIINAILNAGMNNNDASAALKSAIAHPKIQHIFKSVIQSEASVSAASTYLQQQQKMIA